MIGSGAVWTGLMAIAGIVVAALMVVAGTVLAGLMSCAGTALAGALMVVDMSADALVAEIFLLLLRNM